MDIAALRDQLPNATAAELELIARYAMLPEDPRRQRAFEAFLASGLPHRRLEAWKWTDFRAGLPELEGAASRAASDPLDGIDACRIAIRAGAVTLPETWPRGINAFQRTEAQAFGAAEEMPLGALTAALSGQKGGLDTLVIEVRVSPIDVDQVTIGQEASIILSAFDYKTTPRLHGTVSFVSAEASRDKNSGLSFYKVRVSLNDGELDRLPEGLALMPGMPSSTCQVSKSECQ